MLLICILMLLLSTPRLFADEVGLLHGNELKVDSKNKESLKPKVIQAQPSKLPVGTALNDMDDYMRQEEQRVKAIKLLSLDLEKTDLELKQKEVQVKLAQLNKANVGESLGTGAPMPDKSVFIKRLTALTVTEDFKEAVLDINGVPITVHEGDSIIDGKVLHIDAQGVMLAYPSGKQEQLSLNL